jgi:hypothetical protein
METDLEHPFLIGDHPVVLYNYFGDKLGVGVPGVVVYFPLSPEFALGLHCPSIAEEIRKGQEKIVSVIRGRQRTNSSGIQALFAQGNDRKSAGDLADNCQHAAPS